MADERTFLNEGGVYVSNARVVINGTTYATANITSVRQTLTPPNTGCATLIIAFAILMLLGGLVVGKDGAGFVVIGVIGLALGIVLYRSLKPVHHVMLATSAAERQGFSSRDLLLVQRVTAAVAEAITFRG